MFVCIEILASCGLRFPADCLIAFSYLLFLNVLFKSSRILTVFNVFILIFMGLMVYHAGHTVKWWTPLCSLRCPELLWIASPLSVGIQESKIHAEVPLMVVEVLRWWPPPLEEWGKSLCVYQHSDAENTALSQKSIWHLLGCTRLILGDIMKVVICRSLQNCPFMQKQNQKSLAFGVFFFNTWFLLRIVLNLQCCRDRIDANFY